MVTLWTWANPQIREQDPLKQGLKQSAILSSITPLITIREQDPLKQGLKLKFRNDTDELLENS